MRAVLVVGLEPQGGVLAVVGGVDAVVADPRAGHVVEGRDALVDGDGARRAESRGTRLAAHRRGRRVVLAQYRRDRKSVG